MMAQSDAQEELRRRREKLGLSKSALAREAKVNRDTLGDIERGFGFQAATMEKLTRALDRLEAEAGFGVPSGPQPIGDPAERLVTFEVTDLDGYTFVVRGPIEDIEVLREQARALVHGSEMAKKRTGQSG